VGSQPMDRFARKYGNEKYFFPIFFSYSELKSFFLPFFGLLDPFEHFMASLSLVG